MTPATRRRLRWPLAVGGVVFICLVVPALFLPPTTTGDLDSDSASPQGARAAARILRQEGFTVRQVRRSTDLDTTLPSNTSAATARTVPPLLVVVHPELLGPAQLERIAKTSADLILVEPDSVVLDALAPEVVPDSHAPDHTLLPDCDLPNYYMAGAVTGGGTLYRFTGTGHLCFPGNDKTSGQLLEVLAEGPSPDLPRVVKVLGQGDILRNEYLDDEGNAALLLGMTEGRKDIVWYLPDPAELSGDRAAPSLMSLTPGWVWWGTAQLFIAGLAVLAWRGRRLGPLVWEPLPVVVRGAEVQEGRARLYMRVGARSQAAAALRTAALRRAVSRLNLPPDSTVEQVIDSVAQAAGIDPHEVSHLVKGPVPAHDRELVELAERLDALQRALAGPGSPPPDPRHRKADPR